MVQRITLIRLRPGNEENVNEQLQWVGNSLGLFNLRDKDSSCFRVFITLIKTAKRNRALSSDEIAEKLRLSRGTVVHHLTKLMESGIVLREKEGYILREGNLQKMVKDLQQDFDTLFIELEHVAKDIDERLG